MRPSSPPAAKSRSFSYGSKGFRAGPGDGFERAAKEELSLLFRKNAARSRVAAATKPWITAQLRLYGIEFNPNDDKMTLWGTLEAALKSKKCQKPTPEVDAIEESLRQKYDESVKAHSQEVKLWKDRKFAEQAQFGPSSEFFADEIRFMKKYFLDSNGNPNRSKTVKPIVIKCDPGPVESAINAIPGLVAHGWRDCGFHSGWKTLLGWDTAMDRAVEDEFLSVPSTTPPDLTGVIVPGPEDYDVATTEANLDFNRFLQKYFLDSNGNPDRTKTAKPMRLLPHFDNGHLLTAAAARIDGLHVHRVKERYDKISTIIGWNAAEVKAEIVRIETDKQEFDLRMKEEEQRQKEMEAARELEEEMEDWERASKPHREYIASRKPQPGPMTLQDLTGSWIVRGEKSLAFRHTGVLSLEVFPAKSTHGVIASFDFGCVSGTMLLGLSRRSADLLREEQPKHSEWSGGESDDPDEDEGARADISDGYDFGWDSPTYLTERTAAGPSTSQGRLVGASSSAGQKRDLGAVADPWGVQAAMAKRQKMSAQTDFPVKIKAEHQDDTTPITTTSTVRRRGPVGVKKEPQDRKPLQPQTASTKTRVYYQYGYSDKNWYDPEECKADENLGYFDFDSSKVSAKGVFVLENWWGTEGQPLTLFKVADKPKSQFNDGSMTEPHGWYTYDGRGRESRW